MNIPETKMTIPKVPPIEQINFDIDACMETAGQFNEDNEVNGIEFAEVKVEPSLDVFNEAVDCDMSEFVATYDIKTEEPFELNDIDPGTALENNSFFDSQSTAVVANGPVDKQIDMEADLNELLTELPIDIKSISFETEMPKAPTDKETIAKLTYCDICNKQYANLSKCARHMLLVHGIEQADIPRPHKCICGKSYGRSNHLWRHFEKHHSNVPDWSRLVEKPLKIKSKSKEKAVLKASTDKETMAKLSFCHICDTAYANPTVCATHMLQVHNIKQPDIPRPHKCLQCAKSYGRSSHLWRHYEKHHGSIPDRKMKKMMAVMRKRQIDVKVVEESNEIDSIPASESVLAADPTPATDPVPDADSIPASDSAVVETDSDVAPDTSQDPEDEEYEEDEGEEEEKEIPDVAPDKATMAQLSYCHICDRKYANQSACATHMLDLHQIKLPDIPRPHQCLLCDKSYVKPNHLGRHYARAHNESDKNVKIKIKTDRTLGSTTMEIVKNDVEPTCDPIAHTENVKPEIANDAEAPKPAPTWCEICERHYTTRSSLITHMWGVHKIKITPPRPHRCVISTCKKSYKTRVALMNHYRSVHGGNPERKVCASKGRSLDTKKLPEIGTETESGTRDVKHEISEEMMASKARSVCLLCDKRYANHAGCAAHMLQVHKIIMPDVDRPFSCHICKKSYVKNGHLARHLKLGHNIGVQRMGKDASGFECYLCHEIFTHHFMLKRHTAKAHLPVEKSSICPTCGILTERLGRHIYSVHTTKEVQCHICQRVYQHPARLTNHMRTHTLPAQCDLCPKRFPTNGQMQQHRRYHTQEKPFACKHCGARFVERSTCTQHERIHTGEKP